MKLSNIVRYLNLLDSLETQSECNLALRTFDSIMHAVTNQEQQFEDFNNNVELIYSDVNSSIIKFSNLLENLKNNLRDQIKDYDQEYLTKSSQLFNEEMFNDSVTHILHRRMGIDDNSNILLRSKLRNLADWRLPGLIFRPGLETFIEDLVPLDPLYLVDQHIDLIRPAVNSFTTEYQRRLREYVINDQSDEILKELPNNQFGVAFAYNYFNFKPLELIQRYLTELHTKLRPGGTLLMTYNNCDLGHGVALAEKNWMLYQPKRLLVNIAESIGFEIVSSHAGHGDLNWIEMRRPGTITSIRGGQNLAKIIVKSK